MRLFALQREAGNAVERAPGYGSAWIAGNALTSLTGLPSLRLRVAQLKTDPVAGELLSGLLE